MSEPTPTPAPTPTPEPSKAKRTRSAVNKIYLREVSDSKLVSTAALDPAHIPGLAEVELDNTIPARTNALALQLETALGKLTGTRASKKEITAQENAARDSLVEVIAPIQTAAKRKFKGDNISQRDAYFIGGPKQLTSSTLEEVITAARAILQRLISGEHDTPPQDVLPGIKPLGKIKELRDAIAEYDAKNVAQGEQKQAAGTDLEIIASQITVLANLRREIQLAADQAWPWRTEGVKTIRKAFLLPEDRPTPE